MRVSSLISTWVLCCTVVSALCIPAGWAEDVESPDYDVVQAYDDFEVRQYPALLLASVGRDGHVGRAMNRGFMPLADYIFGDNATEEEIAMTAPVMAIAKDEDGASELEQFQIAFVLPSKFESLEELPAPDDDSVTLHELEGLRVAVVRFSGMGSTRAMERRLEGLRAAVESAGLVASGTPIFAKYDPPWTLPWNRRNEVMLPVAAAEDSDAGK